MNKLFSSILTIMAATTINANAATFDNWKNYLAYGDITDIEPAGNMVYVLSSKALFSYSIKDGRVSTYDKVYPLSDCNISFIAWNNTAKKLIAIYEDYNIDLIDNNDNVFNISDYKDKSTDIDKTVNNVVINGNIAYLCTNFGLVQIDMNEGIIRETYNIGKTVLNCAFANNAIYVNTNNGILKGLTKDNLLASANWKNTTDQVSFSHPNDIKVTTENGYTQYYTYDNTNKCYWTNQSDQKLQAYTINSDGTKTITVTDIKPDSPQYNYFGFMKMQNGKLYACNGGNWDQNKPAAIQIYNKENNEWTVYDNVNIGTPYGVYYKDPLCMEVDPQNDNHVWVGAQTGLYEFLNGKVVNHYGADNSTLSYVSYLKGDKNYQIVTSLYYDSNHTLWALCDEPDVSEGVATYSEKTGWSKPDVLPQNSDIDNAKFMGADSYGRIWFCGGRNIGTAVICYSADRKNVYTYKTKQNEDGVNLQPMTAMRCLAEDKEGNIWIATNYGVYILNSEYQQNPSLGFYQIKVPRNDGTNYADYLLASIKSTCIAIDNANRKWIGTENNGIYVISSDNMTQEANFTKTNSALLSDAIEYITVDKQSGRIYIGTDNGLCSVESNATETFDSMDKDNVWAYPNPVKPDYTGLITVVGLSFNADVKITTTNGIVVAEGRSTGGSFQWDGRDKKGKRVASGIYMVNTATESGESGTVCKIAVIN